MGKCRSFLTSDLACAKIYSVNKKERRNRKMLLKMLATAAQNVNTANGAEGTADAATEVWSGLFSIVLEWCMNVGVKILIALVIMFISFKIISKIARKVEKLGDKPNHDKTIMKVLAYIISIGGKCLVAVCLIGYLGIDTSGLTALIASLGVCIGLAVNGAVGNIAGGVLLIITRPFKVDDFIEAQGTSGTVTDIHMTYTRIITPDNKVVYLPNGALSSGNIINYSENDTRRVDLTFSIAYENNFEDAKAIITEVCNAHALILKDKGITVRVSAHNQSSIDIGTKVWVNRADYWTVYFDLLEAVKNEFDAKGISIPYNQLDVHVKNQ